MAIDFNKTFGDKSNAAKSGSATKDERPKTKFWINIGYDSGVADEQGITKFVSLPVGIPLDNQERLPTNSRNQEFAAFQAARNNLVDQIMAVAEKLEPGEEKMLNLQVQLRRINEDQAELPVDENIFAKKLDLL